MMLNLGAGSKTIPGYISVDRAKLPTTDIIADLDVGPWPWDDCTISRIEADSIFEHVHDPILFITECYRILEPGGSVRIRTPHMSSPDSWTDPTHIRHCTEHSFDFWIPGNPHYQANNAAYGGVTFAMPRPLTIERGNIIVTLVRPVL